MMREIILHCTVTILEGSMKGKKGTVKRIAKGVPQFIGVLFNGGGASGLTWYAENEVEVIAYQR